MIINLTLDDQLNSAFVFCDIMGVKFIELILCNNVYMLLGVEGASLRKDADSGKPCSGMALDEKKKEMVMKRLSNCGGTRA